MINQKDLVVAIGGGLIFIVGWIVLELLFASEPSVGFAVVGGIGAGLAWFVGTLIFRKLKRESGSET
jgi:hypothetical protein